MHHNSRLLRTVLTLLATLQLVATGGAPVLEAYADSGRARYFGDRINLHESPEFEHDASTCPVCRLIDTPARIEAKRDNEQVTTVAEGQSRLTPRFVSHSANSWFLSRAPPTNS